MTLYFPRAPWYFVERKRVFPELPLPNPAWLKKDYETCVRTQVGRYSKHL